MKRTITAIVFLCFIMTNVFGCKQQDKLSDKPICEGDAILIMDANGNYWWEEPDLSIDYIHETFEGMENAPWEDVVKYDPTELEVLDCYTFEHNIHQPYRTVPDSTVLTTNVLRGIITVANLRESVLIINLCSKKEEHRKWANDTINKFRICHNCEGVE